MNITIPVKRAELDTDYITKKLFKQISEEEDLLYISSETKANLEEYKAKRNKTSAKSLWKNLLMDSICLLKINDSREKLYNDTNNLIEDGEHFLDRFNKIRSTSTYGIDELASYFDDFVEFESVLYGTGEFYRDHIHHVLQVWGLGIGLLWGNDPIDVKLSEGFKVFDKDFHFQIEENNSQAISKSELWSIWTIIALCHDLGYPLEKASQVNQKVKKIINHFGCMNFNELNFNFDILNTFIVEKYLNIISSKTVRDEKKCEESCLSECTDESQCDIREHHTKVQHKYYDKFSKSLEDYKHGAFSGLLLFKKLTYFLETDFAPNKETLSCEDLRQFYIRKEILRAICGHTCPKIYHLDLNTLSFLLILCDELQEWGRPRFEELVAGESNETQIIEIKEFTTEDITKIYVIIRYDNLEISEVNSRSIEDSIVRRKFQNFHYLLRSAKDDSVRKVDFKWEINFKNKRYVFHFDTELTSYEMFKSYSKELPFDSSDEELFDIYAQS